MSRRKSSESDARFRKALGKRIAHRRETLGQDQESLAKKLGVGRTQLSEWETGAKLPQATALAKLGGLLGCDLHWLITGEDFNVNAAESKYFLPPSGVTHRTWQILTPLLPMLSLIAESKVIPAHAHRYKWLALDIETHYEAVKPHEALLKKRRLSETKETKEPEARLVDDPDDPKFG